MSFFPVILFSAIRASELWAGLRFILPLLSSLLVRWSLSMMSLNFCSAYPLWFLNSKSICSASVYNNPKGQAGVILKTRVYVAILSVTFRTFARAQRPRVSCPWARGGTGVTRMPLRHPLEFREKRERSHPVIFPAPFHPRGRAPFPPCGWRGGLAASLRQVAPPHRGWGRLRAGRREGSPEGRRYPRGGTAPSGLVGTPGAGRHGTPEAGREPLDDARCASASSSSPFLSEETKSGESENASVYISDWIKWNVPQKGTTEVELNPKYSNFLREKKK